MDHDKGSSKHTCDCGMEFDEEAELKAHADDKMSDPDHAKMVENNKSGGGMGGGDHAAM